MQDNVPSSDIDAQSPNLLVLDGIRPHYPAQPSESSRPTFSNALKFGLGSHGGDLKPSTEPKPSDQLGTSEPPRVILMEDSSNPPVQPPLTAKPVQSKDPSVSVVELTACCLLGKIWGESIPSFAIIHRTYNEWRFTKGQLDYVNLGND